MNAKEFCEKNRGGFFNMKEEYFNLVIRCNNYKKADLFKIAGECFCGLSNCGTITIEHCISLTRIRVHYTVLVNYDGIDSEKLKNILVVIRKQMPNAE